MDVMKKVPVREQAPDVRNKNFDEVCLGYNAEEAQEEATRCLNCKNAKCVQGCPVSINIPEFIHNVKEGNFEEAYKVIGKSSALPAVCGRCLLYTSELPFKEAGLNVVFTKDHHPYKERKVRILNGSHTSFVLASFLAGNDNVENSMKDPVKMCIRDSC